MIILNWNNISLSFGERKILDNVTFSIQDSDRIGKLEKKKGNIEFGHNVVVGYFDQHQEDIYESNSIINEIWNSSSELS